MTDALLELIKQVSSIQDTLDYLRSLDSGSGGGGTVTAVTATAPIASSGGTTPNITHNNSGVAAATFTNATITTDLTGHVTAASSGTAPVTSVGVTAPITSTGGTTPTIGLSVTPTNPGGAVALQASTPGTEQTGHINISGTVDAGNTAYTGQAVTANNTSVTNPTIKGVNANTTGAGVRGEGGQYGIYGKATASSGTVYGGYFDGDNTGGTGSTGSYGVYAIGEAYGVYGQGNSNAGFGGYFNNSGANAVALKGEVTSGSGSIGVQGAATGHGVDGTSATNSGYGVYGSNTAASDGVGAAAKFDGGSHTNGLQVVNNHATKETINGTNSGAGSAGIFANNGGNATVTATNSGAGIGLTGSTADSGSPGVKGQNTGSGVGIEGYSSSGIAAYFHTGTDQPQVKAQAVASQTSPIYGAYDSGGSLIGGLYYSAQGPVDVAYVSPNYVMNGDMLINQRFGPAGTLAIATGAQKKYMVDRWYLDKDGTSQGTLSQIAFTVGQTDVPNEPQYYLDWNHSTAGTGGTKDNIQHNIESVRTLAGKQVTFSIYMKVASGTQAVTLELEQNFGSGGSPSSPVLYTKGSTDTVTTTFQRFTYTVTLTGISGKTIGTTAFSDSLIVRVKNPLNAAYQISYAHAQLELGPLATPYRVTDYQTELIRCQRYFSKSFDDTQAVATNSANRNGEIVIIQSVGASATMRAWVPFKVNMRVAPTVTIYNGQAANNQIRNLSVPGDWSATSTLSSGNTGVTVTGTTNGSSTAGQISVFQYGAEADY